jgi:hypothetical protein
VTDREALAEVRARTDAAATLLAAVLLDHLDVELDVALAGALQLLERAETFLALAEASA